MNVVFKTIVNDMAWILRLNTFNRFYKRLQMLHQRHIHVTTQASVGVEKGKRRESLTVCVEGNIASGKTTFIEHFKNNENIEAIEEPVERWRDLHGYNIMDKFYDDPQQMVNDLRELCTTYLVGNPSEETDQTNKIDGAVNI
uniref:Deoxynucleoside kinase-like n=1 Tax=Crassostrea virginica TaxID=6565 RepID=A0A8B8AYT9_CRAVI|nr:deoxynucleoside kinase-like [Crassostrea virginica]XP_022295924.1 deoxynucleoside kinase-like [Crassostrea virginica]